MWTDECQEQFDKVKVEMDNLVGLIPYDLEKPIEIYTDTSKEGGLGYIMAQPQDDGTRAVIQMESTGLTDCQSRYSIPEIEMLAAVWSLENTKIYMLGPKK